MKNFLSILLVEDNVIEIMKIRRTITTLNNNYKLVEVRNGEEALLYLKAKNTIPDIILLDLNMPKIGGIEFLSILKKNEKCAKNLIFCEFFRANFSCNFEFSFHDGNIFIKKKHII